MNAAENLLTRLSERKVALPAPAQRRAIRIAAGASQQDVAFALEGIDRATVARWELGTREPRGDLRRRYADLLAKLRHV